MTRPQLIALRKSLAPDAMERGFRQLRKGGRPPSKGISQFELAERLLISHRTVQGWERKTDPKKPNAATLKKLLKLKSSLQS